MLGRLGPPLAALLLAAVAAGAAGDARAGEGRAPDEDDDVAIPSAVSSPADEPPRGAQDGAIAGATAGAALGILRTATTAAAGTSAAPPRTSARYAALDRGSCEGELVRRRIPFERVAEARGVLAPVRVTGPIGGVTFRSMLPEKQRRSSPYEIYDCRLVLALDDYARILARHDIVEVVHFSVYRPPPAKMTGLGRRHAGGLAIDAGLFRTKTGETLSVEKDFHGRIGGKPCGVPTGSLPEKAKTLRSVVCEAADAQLFNVMLTPDYNWKHRNHFHLEVTAGVRWMFVR
jgi:hypothetical protein